MSAIPDLRPPAERVGDLPRILREMRQSVREALQTLAPKDREILLLKYTEDWSYHQLVTHLGIGHSAVEARLHRARQRFRAELTALAVIEVEQ